MDETLVCIFGATLLLLLSAAIVANYEEIWDFFYSFFHDLSRLIKQRQVGQTTKSSPSPMHPISSPQLTSEQLAELRLQQDLTELDLCALAAQVAILQEMTDSSNIAD
ncbi:MAG: hypothetical protein IJQ02_01570 [Oscillospiraceae bacterium]|nr:hypothetical protein [Oscillospiraceae bacterium]